MELMFYDVVTRWLNNSWHFIFYIRLLWNLLQCLINRNSILTVNLFIISFLIFEKECELAMEGLKKLQKKGNYQRDDLLKYPQNSLRNLARDRLDTKLFYLVDIDTIPAAGLRDEFNKYARKVGNKKKYNKYLFTFRITFMIKLMNWLHLLRPHLKYSEIKRIQKINEKFFIMKKIKMLDRFTMQLVLIAMVLLNMKTGVPGTSGKIIWSYFF